MDGIRSNKGEINTDGYYYQLYTLLYCIDRLRKETSVGEYDIGNAVVGYGALDDVVFNATLANGKTITYAIQVKHTNKMIDERYLCQDQKTNLYKYMQSLMKTKNSSSIEQLILWTNMPIANNIRDWFEKFVPDSDKCDILGKGNFKTLYYDRFRIKSVLRQGLVTKIQDYVQQKERDASQKNKTINRIETYTDKEWNCFFEKFVFYVNVPKVNELKAFLVKNIGNCFDDLCNLIDSCAVKQITTSDHIENLFKLVNFRKSMESGPYTELIFNDMDELQWNVETLFDYESIKSLRIKASQDVECTLARLITVVEICLAGDSKRYLVFSYKSINKKWDELQLVLTDPKIIETGLKCLIITSITDAEACELEKIISGLKLIFVGNKLKTKLEDDFDVKCLDDSIKNVINEKKIRLSEWQDATVYEVFGKALFRKKNYLLVLELYKWTKYATFQITSDEPMLDSYYQSRITKLISANNSTTRIDLIGQTSYDKLIIHDQAGMGKTTEMVKLVFDFRAKYQSHLIVYLHCREAVTKWKGGVEGLICSIVRPCIDLTRHLICKIIQFRKMILILDGYDEVSREYNEILKKLVSEASSARIPKLYIATRTQCKEEISNILWPGKCGLCCLEPFNKNDQLEYLKKYWNIEELYDDDKKKAIIANADYIIEQFRSIMNGSSLIEIPLQTYMIAVIYESRIVSSELDVSKSRTLGFIYEEFVELKFMENVKKHFISSNATHALIIEDLRQKFLQDHVEAALKIDQGYNAEANRESSSETEIKILYDRIQHYGIVLTRPVVAFIHYSYQEYFLALYLLTFSVEVKLMEYFISRYIDRNDSLVFRFMNYLLSQTAATVYPNRNLNKSFNTNELSSNYVPPITKRLHSEKMAELNATLSRMDTITITNLFSCLIHHRLINMMEVIYDSLSENTKSQMRLCKDHGNCGISHVCFRFEDVDILISFLSILLKDNPNTSITLYFSHQKFASDFSYNRTESLLELMCCPEYCKIFDWLIENIPQFNKQQRKALILIIKRQMDRCLQQIIRNNNIKLLDKIIEWIKNTLSKDAASVFLTKVNLLRLLAENIEFEISETDESERHKMVNSVLDLYDWAFNEKPSFGKGLSDALQNITSNSIVEVFQSNLQLNSEKL